MRPTKISILRKHMIDGDWPAAIRLAAKFPQLGAEAADITRAKDALLRPGFYRQIGNRPSILIAKGRAALERRYPI